MAEHGTTTKRPDGMIMTFTGKLIRPLNMRLDDICLEDIAHAMSMKCRYTGHVRLFYSVGEHCVLMARRNLPGPASWRLMHDASEAYLPDIASPIKDQFPLIKEAEEHILTLIADRFGLPPYSSVYADVHKADVAMMVWEGQRNMNDRDNQGVWWIPGLSDEYPMCEGFCSWDPQKAEEEFLKEAKCLLDL